MESLHRRASRTPRRRWAARCVLAGTTALLVATGPTTVLAQPTTTPAAPTTPTQSAPATTTQSDSAPASTPGRGPVDTSTAAAPETADPCAVPTTTTPAAPTTTTPTTTTPTTTTSATDRPCETTPPAVPAPAAVPTAESAPTHGRETARPETAPAPTPAQASAVPPAETVAPLPAELRPAPPAADQPVPPDDPARSSKTAEPDPDWHPTENPKSTLVPGQMRSDREEVPAPFTKEDADKAEIAEARLRSSRSLTASSCQVYWPSWFQVCGAIRDKYNSLGGPASFLSYPTSGNILNPGGTGERVTFANGPIYWSAATGAHPVVNSFLNRWGIHGYEAGWLKYPTTDEVVLPDGGRRQEFQEGAIYVAFQNAIGSAIRNGPLRDKYNAVGGLAPGGTLLGYPIQDQIGLPDGQGQMDRFERGVIYWHPTTGAYTIHGEILDRWADSGYESGAFGYPTSEQITDANDRFKQQFQHGEIETYTLFEGQFEWEDTAGVIKWCHFRGRTDRVHYSTSVINNVPVKDTASAHVWWEAIKDCKPMTTATVTAQLQSKNSAGEWVNRGAEKVEHSVYPGGGSANRAAANDKCIGFAPTTWRVVGDVDINGSPDAPDLTYGEPRIGFECG